MTDRVRPSKNTTGIDYQLSRLVERGGGYGGYVAPANDHLLADEDANLDETAMNEFAQSSSGSSLDVTIDPGEAVVSGALVARDVSTTVTLAASTNGQSVYVGWDREASDTVIIGLASAFDSVDRKLEIWQFDTDGSGVTNAADQRQVDQPGSGGISHVQTSEPSYNEGDNWVDPSTGIYYAAYDGGNGGDWHPIPSVQILDEATAFDGSDGENVTHTSTEVSGGSIQLSDSIGPTADRPNDNSSYGSVDASYGLKINPNTSTAGVRFDVSQNCDSEATEAHVRDSNKNILATKSASNTYSPGDTIEIMEPLTSGTDYYLTLYFPTGNYGAYDSPSWPYNNTDFDLLTSYNDGSDYSNLAVAVNNIKAVNQPTSGDALIYWGNPTDLKSWDLATFQRTLDNETVSIDIEDANQNVLFSDISKHFDISTVSDSKEIRIRANLSRNDTSNNPTLDYCARRYVR